MAYQAVGWILHQPRGLSGGTVNAKAIYKDWRCPSVEFYSCDQFFVSSIRILQP